MGKQWKQWETLFLGAPKSLQMLDYKESWTLKNWCFWTVVLKKSPESPLDCKEIKPVNPKANQSWIFFGRTHTEVEAPNTLATWCRELTQWKRPWYWERFKAGGGDDRGWYGRMVSPTQWTWVWVDFGSWWWTGRPGMLQFMGSQRVGHDWVTELIYLLMYLILEYRHSLPSNLKPMWDHLLS